MAENREHCHISGGEGGEILLYSRFSGGKFYYEKANIHFCPRGLQGGGGKKVTNYHSYQLALLTQRGLLQFIFRLNIFILIHRRSGDVDNTLDY